MPQERKLNSAQRNHIKKTIQELKNKRTSEIGKICGWLFVAIILCFTIFAPYVAYGYIKQAIITRRALKQEIKELTAQIS